MPCDIIRHQSGGETAAKLIYLASTITAIKDGRLEFNYDHARSKTVHRVQRADSYRRSGLLSLQNQAGARTSS